MEERELKLRMNQIPKVYFNKLKVLRTSRMNILRCHVTKLLYQI